MPQNPAGDFLGLDPDYDLGQIKVQWRDLGNGSAAKVHMVYESRNYVWDGISAWIREVQPGSSASPITVTDATTSNNLHAAATAVTQGATQTLLTVALTAGKFRGFTGTGEGDGHWSVQLNGTELYAWDTGITARSVFMPLPVAELLTGSLTLKVTNNGTGTGNFSGTLLID